MIIAIPTFAVVSNGRIIFQSPSLVLCSVTTQVVYASVIYKYEKLIVQL